MSPITEEYKLMREQEPFEWWYMIKQHNVELFPFTADIDLVYLIIDNGWARACLCDRWCRQLAPSPQLNPQSLKRRSCQCLASSVLALGRALSRDPSAERFFYLDGNAIFTKIGVSSCVFAFQGLVAAVFCCSDDECVSGEEGLGHQRLDEGEKHYQSY